MLTCMLVALTYLDQGDAVLQLLLAFVETLESLAERYQTEQIQPLTCMLTTFKLWICAFNPTIVQSW